LISDILFLIFFMPNRLGAEKSPYLLQHADNPVDWHPWGPEAFDRAWKEDKPIFLSIGYSTCHWCHVMERESFQNPETAVLINEVFIPIKVDREERPDLDNIYMSVCQMMISQGGWPLTIFLTADKKPFFAATYIPRETRFGRIGLLELIPRIRELWKDRRPELISSAEKLASLLREAGREERGEDLDGSILELAYRALAQRFDDEFGGFGKAPKFPTPHNLLFLLRYYQRTGKTYALEKVEKTLQAMRRGGIYDHVGFGFHRYSTDEKWIVPHFEKMLYDQAQLALAYTEGYLAIKNEEYRRTAEEIFTYVLRDLADPDGGFHSAEDADSEGEEGKYYLWTEEEIRRVLDPAEADFVLRNFNLERDGNFIDPFTGQKEGKIILHLRGPLSEPEPRERWEQARVKLFNSRAQRVHPFKDDKVLTDWNGLMIAALARGAQAFNHPAYAEAGKKAVDFILKNLQDPAGLLLHRYRDGQAAIPAQLDDYAFLILGLYELYEATFEVRFLEKALGLCGQAIKYFWDDQSGGFFLTAADGEDLLIRPREFSDGATPSGNSVMALNLLRLGRVTANPDFETRAQAIGRALSREARQSPSSFTFLMMAVDFGVGPASEVVIAGDPGREDTREMLRALRNEFFPGVVVILRPTEEESPAIVRLAGFTRDLITRGGKATAYVCRNYQCELPTTDPRDMLELLSAFAKNTGPACGAPGLKP